MKSLKEIKSWPIEKKRIFSISLAVIFTGLIIVLNLTLNSVWKEEVSNKGYDKNDPMSIMQKSFVKIFSDAETTLEQAFSGSTTEKIIEQINSASSSFSTTSNIVE